MGADKEMSARRPQLHMVAKQFEGVNVGVLCLGASPATASKK